MHTAEINPAGPAWGLSREVRALSSCPAFPNLQYAAFPSSPLSLPARTLFSPQPSPFLSPTPDEVLLECREALFPAFLLGPFLQHPLGFIILETRRHCRVGQMLWPFVEQRDGQRRDAVGCRGTCHPGGAGSPGHTASGRRAQRCGRQVASIQGKGRSRKQHGCVHKCCWRRRKN